MSTRKNVLVFIINELKKFYPECPIYQSKMAEAIEDERYITVDLMAERDIGSQERWNVPDEEIAVVGLCEATLNIQAFGDEAIEMLSMLSFHLTRPSIVDEFYLANIAVNGVDEVQDLTGLLDGNFYYERASVDLTISYDRTVIDDPGWFEVIKINGVLVEGNLINAVVPSKIKLETNIEIKENA